MKIVSDLTKLQRV